jgi:hypothetical protein
MLTQPPGAEKIGAGGKFFWGARIGRDKGSRHTPAEILDSNFDRIAMACTNRLRPALPNSDTAGKPAPPASMNAIP